MLSNFYVLAITAAIKDFAKIKVCVSVWFLRAKQYSAAPSKQRTYTVYGPKTPLGNEQKLYVFECLCSLI